MEQHQKEKRERDEQDRAAYIDPLGQEPNNEMCC